MCAHRRFICCNAPAFEVFLLAFPFVLYSCKEKLYDHTDIKPVLLQIEHKTQISGRWMDGYGCFYTPACTSMKRGTEKLRLPSSHSDEEKGGNYKIVGMDLLYINTLSLLGIVMSSAALKSGSLL